MLKLIDINTSYFLKLKAINLSLKQHPNTKYKPGALCIKDIFGVNPQIRPLHI